MRKSKVGPCLALAISVAGCTSTPLSSALGTLKNPYPVLAHPTDVNTNEFVGRNYEILRRASEAARPAGGDPEMRDYLGAGFALSDIYCDAFLRDADESQRRRRFGRGVTNDAGTAIATILGLANAGENLVTGVAAGFGLGDNLWRNYDESFVVSANLANVRSLILAAQDNFRELTLGQQATNPLPQDYGTAQSVIMRYANFCSTLGAQELLNRSADEQREQLDQETQEQRSGQAGKTQPPPANSATPPITSNAEGAN